MNIKTFFLARVLEYNYLLVLFENVPVIFLSHHYERSRLGFLYIKVNEDILADGNEDAQIYNLDGFLRTSPLRVRPGFFLYEVEERSDWGGVLQQRREQQKMDMQ